MIIMYYNKVKNNEPISTAFKVAVLILVSLPAGIIMLVDDNN